MWVGGWVGRGGGVVVMGQKMTIQRVLVAALTVEAVICR